MEKTQDNASSENLTPADDTATEDRRVNVSDASVALESSSVNETQALLTQAQARASALEEELLRAQAETENARRRAWEDVQKAHRFAIENLAKNLLLVLDSLEAALTHSNDFAQLREGWALN